MGKGSRDLAWGGGKDTHTPTHPLPTHTHSPSAVMAGEGLAHPGEWCGLLLPGNKGQTHTHTHNPPAAACSPLPTLLLPQHGGEGKGGRGDAGDTPREQQGPPASPISPSAARQRVLAGSLLAPPSQAGDPPPSCLCLAPLGGFSQASSGWDHRPGTGHAPQREHHLNEALRHRRYPWGRDGGNPARLPARVRRLGPPSPAAREKAVLLAWRPSPLPQLAFHPHQPHAGLHPPGSAQGSRGPGAAGQTPVYRHEAQSVPENLRPLGRGSLRKVWERRGCRSRVVGAGLSLWLARLSGGFSGDVRMRREEWAGGAMQVLGRGAERGHAART